MENHQSIEQENRQCSLQCYKNYEEDINSNMPFENQFNRLQNCVKFCKKPQKDIEVYDRNIDFLTLTKFEGCSKSCYKDFKSKDSESSRDFISLLKGKKEDKENESEFIEEDIKNLKKENTYTQCQDDCYMRLLKRYRGYWLKHKNKLLERYNSKQI